LTALVESGRSVYVATGSAADPRKAAAVKSQGARVLDAGGGTRVEGRALIEALAREQLWNIALIAGGEIQHTLVVDNALDRLYLTVACSMLGGLSFDTLLTGPALDQAAPFTLKALHYDPHGAEKSNVEQLFAVFDRSAHRVRA
jgi:riboflavin biosynthesis pyrimidine reductase